MMIPAKALSETLSSMASSRLAAIRSRLDDLDDVLCAAILIEAARVMDYESVLMASDPEGYHLPYPTFDVMSRGWNSLLSYALPRLPRTEGMPFAESTAETRARARFLLHAFGEAAVLQKAADMSFHGFLTGSETEDGISLKSVFGENNDHFHDQLEADALEIALGGAKNTSSEGLLSADEALQITTRMTHSHFPK